jgi:hypothetical protein
MHIGKALMATGVTALWSAAAAQETPAAAVEFAFEETVSLG